MARKSQNSTDASETRKRALGVGCLLAFALPFAAAGTLVIGWSVRDVWQWRDMQRWVQTPAVLVATKLENKRGDKGRATHRATATYRYAFNGKAHQGDRVALHTGRDNIGSYQQDRARELNRIKAGGGRLNCYVNPDNPAEAVLFRDLRSGLVALKVTFGLLFASIGYGLMAAALVGGRIARRQELARSTTPDAPWLWREDWASGRIGTNAGAAAWGVTIFATFWNSISIPTAILVFTTKTDAERGAEWVIAAFPLIGAFLAAWAGYLWLRRLRWGGSEFEMAAVPGVLGGPLAGVIHVPARVEPLNGFLVRLACVRRVEVDGPNESRTEDQTLWEHDYQLMRDLADATERTLIPVQFVIPYELPPSDDDVTWKLSAQAETRGVDFHAEFEAPVFKTDASSAAVTTDSAATTSPLAAPTDFATAVRGMGATLVDDAPDQRTIVFPMFRNPGMAAFLVVFTAGWASICVGLFYSDAPRFFPWVFSAFGLLLLPVALRSAFGRTRLQFGPGGVRLRGGMLGWGRLREFGPAEITDVNVRKSGTTWGSVAYRKVELHTRAGKRQTLVSEIARPRDADRLAQEIRSAVGLSEKRKPKKSSRMSLESTLPAELAGE